MKRRNFFIALGSLAGGLTITGYFLFHRSPQQQSSSSTGDPQPKLKPDVVFRERDGQLTVRRGQGESTVVCAVNATGAAILQRLDGKHTVEKISMALSARLSIAPSQSLEAKVATFIAQLAMCGFLSKPYYATIFETREA